MLEVGKHLFYIASHLDAAQVVIVERCLCRDCPLDHSVLAHLPLTLRRYLLPPMLDIDCLAADVCTCKSVCLCVCARAHLKSGMRQRTLLNESQYELMACRHAHMLE